MAFDKSLTNFKRNYDTGVTCINCNKSTVVSDKAISYNCHFCGKYNSVEKASKNFENGNINFGKDNRSSVGFPSVREESDQARDYMSLRDEYEIRADLYAKGKTRDSMGVDKFSNTLKKELKQNKCYRGWEKTGV